MDRCKGKRVQRHNDTEVVGTQGGQGPETERNSDIRREEGGGRAERNGPRKECLRHPGTPGV